MGRRFAITLLAFIFMSSVVFVAHAKELTGNDYLKLSKKDRVAAVTSLINGAKSGGVTIKQSPVQYCKKLDAFYAKHPDMRGQQLATVLKTLIIMEYDWQEKGVDKDALARQWLGDKIYAQNKARFQKR